MVRSVLVVQHQGDCPPALLGTWLVEAGCRLDVRHPYAGDELPADLDDHDALLVLGGSMGAHDDQAHPWLTPTKQLVREAATRRVPTLGVCLGHQLAAAALGGRCGRNPRGQQLGLLPVGWTDAASSDPLTGALVAARAGLHWNDDVVLRAPAATVALARAPGGELQAAQFAPTVWGVQLHPEVDEQVLARWASEDRDHHEEGVLDAVVAEVARRREELASWWRPLAHALAGLCAAGRAPARPEAHDPTP